MMIVWRTRRPGATQLAPKAGPQLEHVGGVRSVDRGIRKRVSVLGIAFALLAMLQPAAAIETTSLPSRPSFELPVGEGRVLHLDEPAESVYIADSSIANLTVVAPDVVYVYGKKTGTTNLIAVSVDQRVQASIEFRVALDSRPLNQARRELARTGTMDVTIFGDRAAVRGNARTVEEAVNAASAAQTYSPPGQPPINNATIDGSQQVNIRVRFAEISRSDLHSVGLDWRQILENASNLSFGRTGRENGLIESLQRSGIITILAEPNLTAVTGQTASFLAGGEIPVPFPGGPNGQVTIQYKPFGVSLEFTPTIIRSNRIGLHVRPEVSAMSQAGAVKINGFDIPSFTVRRADSTVEMASGETFAMAGLFQRNMTPDVALKFPVLGELPVLGALFQSERYRRNETELVILITPYLVKPVRDRRIATPLDRPYAPPEEVSSVQPSRAPAAARTSGLIFK
jgi:pilus assembly protein CpaC